MILLSTKDSYMNEFAFNLKLYCMAYFTHNDFTYNDFTCYLKLYYITRFTYYLTIHEVK